MRRVRSTPNKKSNEHDYSGCVDEINTHVYQNEMVDDFLIRTRRIILVGEIDEVSSTHVCDRLQILSLTKEPIYLYINSPGGSLNDGYAIIDQMMLSQCPIWTIIRGQAHSMAGVVAAFGAKGHRYSSPNSSIMLHSVVIQNPPDSVDRQAKMVFYIQEDYVKKVSDLSKRLKLTTKQLLELMEKTIWMSPRQAIKIGLIDKVWTPQLERNIDRGITK